MIVAKVRALNNSAQSKVAKEAGVDKGYVAQASIVLQYRPDLAESVVAGMALNEAAGRAALCAIGMVL